MLPGKFFAPLIFDQVLERFNPKLNITSSKRPSLVTASKLDNYYFLHNTLGVFFPLLVLITIS